MVVHFIKLHAEFFSFQHSFSALLISLGYNFNFLYQNLVRCHALSCLLVAGAGACLQGDFCRVVFMGINLRESYFYVQGTTLKFSSHLESKNGGTNIYLGLNIKEIQYQEGPKRK